MLRLDNQTCSQSRSPPSKIPLPGTRVSQSALPSADGQWPLYAPAGRTAQVLGWLRFADRPESDRKGHMSWIRLPDARGPLYPRVFTTVMEAVGSRFQPPGANWIVNFGVGSRIEFVGGGLRGALSIRLATGSRRNLMPGDNLGLKFNSANGLFSGQVRDPVTGRTLPYWGAALQKHNAGSGLVSGSDGTGQITLWP